MTAAVPTAAIEPDTDQFVYLRMGWQAFEKFLALKGDEPVPRVTYLDGVLELMSPSRSHEGITRLLARLLEAYAEETGRDLDSYGSWTLKHKRQRAGIEPDNCFVVDGGADPRIPDLAIEVVWTHGGLEKLELYRRLGVGEVWIWRDSELLVFVLRSAGFARSARSRLFPQLDLKLLRRLATSTNQSRAVRELRAAVRKH
jgi:Uma2 family endonuclease